MEEIKTLKVLGGTYILLFLTLIGSIVLAVFDYMTAFVVCLSISMLGTWIFHSIIIYHYKDYEISKFFAFGFGLLNLWTLEIWGLILSIKVLAESNY